MARGISTEPIPYVLEADRGLRSEEQTVFYIKPRSGHDENYITKQYLNAYIEKDDKRDLDVRAADAADVSTFKKLVSKVENFAFSDEYYEKHPAMKEKAIVVKLADGEEALFVSLIDSVDGIADVCHELDSASLREIISVSRDYSKLEEGQKK